MRIKKFFIKVKGDIMDDFQIAYLPIGVPTFHLESATKEFEASIKTLKDISDDVATEKQEKILLIISRQ